mmetsp:Transcript_29903/g.86014  ORF Transcript_29903/g.86014 Transcript_29903/m.86014 type:complete len:345 (+) Transcript_29903:1648-2682(+)
MRGVRPAASVARNISATASSSAQRSSTQTMPTLSGQLSALMSGVPTALAVRSSRNKAGETRCASCNKPSTKKTAPLSMACINGVTPSSSAPSRSPRSCPSARAQCMMSRRCWRETAPVLAMAAWARQVRPRASTEVTSGRSRAKSTCGQASREPSAMGGACCSMQYERAWSRRFASTRADLAEAPCATSCRARWSDAWSLGEPPESAAPKAETPCASTAAAKPLASAGRCARNMETRSVDFPNAARCSGVRPSPSGSKGTPRSRSFLATLPKAALFAGSAPPTPRAASRCNKFCPLWKRCVRRISSPTFGMSVNNMTNCEEETVSSKARARGKPQSMAAIAAPR